MDQRGEYKLGKIVIIILLYEVDSSHYSVTVDRYIRESCSPRLPEYGRNCRTYIFRGGKIFIVIDDIFTTMEFKIYCFSVSVTFPSSPGSMFMVKKELPKKRAACPRYLSLSLAISVTFSGVCSLFHRLSLQAVVCNHRHP